jgi:hypothetical protein
MKILRMCTTLVMMRTRCEDGADQRLHNIGRGEYYWESKISMKMKMQLSRDMSWGYPQQK